MRVLKALGFGICAVFMLMSFVGLVAGLGVLNFKALEYLFPLSENNLFGGAFLLVLVEIMSLIAYLDPTSPVNTNKAKPRKIAAYMLEQLYPRTESEAYALADQILEWTREDHKKQGGE